MTTSTERTDAPGYSMFPLSHEQHRLWLVHQVAAGSTAYHVPAAVRLRGDLDLNALRGAVESLVAAHEPLRTTIRRHEGTPYQHVDDTARADFQVVEVPDRTEAALTALVSRHAYEPFDLAEGPLLRTRVFVVAPDDAVLLLCAHHIVVDAWSLRLLLTDLGTRYDLRRANLPDPPPDEGPQFGDFAAWQREQPAGVEDQALTYWQDRLTGAPHLSVADVATASPVTGRVTATVDARSVRALASLAGVTPMTVFLAAWVIALSQQVGRRDVSVLVPVANRDRTGTEHLVGFFVNTIVVRVELPLGATFGDVLRCVRTRCVEAYAHQSAPFERVVDRVAPERALGRTPFSDVLFAYTDVLGEVGLAGLGTTVFPLPPGDAKCELVLEVRPEGGQYTVTADHSMDRVSAARATTLVTRLVESVRAGLDTPVELPEGAEPAPARTAAPAGVAPRTAGEDRARALFATALEQPLDRIGVHDDFFALGGNSLLATRLVNRLAADHGDHVTLRAFLAAPTAAGLAALLDGAPGPTGRGPVALPRPGGGEPWPARMSFAQERLWFLAQVSPGDPAYHVPVILRVTGTVDVPALCAAVTGLTARHEILRTSFGMHEERPTQWVHAAVRVPVRESDDPAQVADEIVRPFDLAAAPLLRLLVVRQAADEYLLVLTMHHIVCDEVSTRVLARDLRALYAAERRGAEPDLPALAIQYADAAAWQRDRLDADALVGHWRSALAGAPTRLELPTDRPRPAVPAHRGADLRCAVPADLAEAIRTLAAARRMTPFMVILAALGVTLGRYAGQREVVIGSPVAGRTHAALDDLVGFFANTIALRVDTAGPGRVVDLLDRVRATCHDAFAHQDLPFEQVVDAVAPTRVLSANPLFQVMLAVEEPAAEVTLDGARVELVRPAATIGKFDLTVLVADLGTVVARYDTDLFDEATVARLMAHLVATLGRFAADPYGPVTELDPLHDDERRRLLTDWNQAPAHYPVDVPLHELVLRQAAATPDAVAVSGCLDCRPGEPCQDLPAHLTYRELVERASALAAALTAAGVRRGDVVGLLLDRSAAVVIAELATLVAGAAFLPLDPAHPAPRTTAVIEDARCAVVVTAARHAGRAPDGVPVVAVDQGRRSECQPVPTHRHDLAYVVYTSGSTGGPKGALLDHAGIVNNLCWMQQEWPLDGGDRLLFKTVHTFDVAVKEVFWPLIAGAQVVVAHPGAERDAHEICERVERAEVTVLHLVPSMLDVVLAVSRGRGLSLSSLRLLMAGAESLPAATHDEILERLPALLLHMYGPTETAIAVTGWPCREPVGTGRLPLGRAMPNAALYVLDDRLRPLPQGAIGELYVGGFPVGRGYLGRGGLTAAAYLPDPYAGPGARMYRTGDLVRYRNDGLLEFRGRRDNQVKIRGQRVEPGEVAEVLARHPAVRQAVVTPWPRQGPATALVAYAVADGVTPDEVRAHLRERLPAYLVPAFVELVGAMPTGNNGKVDVARLPAPAGRDTGEPPRGPTETRIAELWCELLDVPTVGRTDSFFDVGGHSLLATRLAARFAAEFGHELPLRDLFAEPTVAALARRLATAPTRPGARIPVVDRVAFRVVEE